MFIELSLSDGSPLSVDKALVKLFTPTKVLQTNETFVPGTLVWVEGYGNLYVLESYEDIRAMVTRKKAVRKQVPEPGTVIRMRKKPREV